MAEVDVELIQLPTGPVVIFSIQNPRDPSPDSVRRFEQVLRERLADSSVSVVVRTVDSADITAKGRILYGAAHFGEKTEEERARQAAVEAAVRSGLQAVPDMFVTAVDGVPSEDGWSVRAEVVGPRVLTPSEVVGAEKAASAVVGAPVSISARARTDVVVDGRGYGAVGSIPE